MARFDTSGLDATVKWMEQMELTTGQLADSMLLAGAAEVREAWQEAATLHHHRLTDQMYKSIGYARTPKTVEGVRTIDIYPQGKDDKNVRNAEKAFITHYGTSKRPGSRWIDDADEISARTVVPAMLRVYQDYMRDMGA